MPQPLRKRVCLGCQVRKKRCDKRKPQCTACKERGYECQYAPSKSATNVDLDTSARKKSTWTTIAPASILPSPPSTAANASVGAGSNGDPPLLSIADNSGIPRQVYRLVENTGRYIDDITSDYFRTIHQWLPIVSRGRFQRSLVADAAAQSIEFSMLLLSICLVTYRPVPRSRQPVRRSLYMATKMLLSQAQASNAGSVDLIRANLLCAVFEYAQGRADIAYVTIGICARMAHVAAIHKRRMGPDVQGSELTTDVLERRNLMWATFIMERVIMCEISERAGLPSTPIHFDVENLPVEAALLDRGDVDVTPQAPLSPLLGGAMASIGVFGRQAQAACLLDRVLRMIDAFDGAKQHRDASQTDAELRAFVGSVMEQASDTETPFCDAIAVAVRALFLLHSHILSHPPDWTPLAPGDEQRKSSRIALATFTEVAVEIAHSHTRTMRPSEIEMLSPSCMYMLREALGHLNLYRYPGLDAWARDCRALRCALALFDACWAAGQPLESWQRPGLPTAPQ